MACFLFLVWAAVGGLGASVRPARSGFVHTVSAGVDGAMTVDGLDAEAAGKGGELGVSGDGASASSALPLADYEAICDCGLVDFGTHLVNCSERQRFRYVIAFSHEAAAIRLEAVRHG